MCREPMEIFQFLQKKDIGQKYSLFYEAFSTFLELRGRYTEAMNVFQKGIANSAQPEERLKLKFEDFQRRMVGRIQRQQRRMANNGNHMIIYIYVFKKLRRHSRQIVEIFILSFSQRFCWLCGYRRPRKLEI